MSLRGVHFTKLYARYRVREPSSFVKNSLRTQSLGKKRQTKRIAGRLKSSGRWATQAVLLPRKFYASGQRVVRKKGGKFLVVK